MIITMNRPAGAPFDLYSTVDKQALIPEKDVENMRILSWESMEIKNYCLAVNRQRSFDLEKIQGLKEIQVTSRKTATLWLNDISLRVNALYDELASFCRIYKTTHEELSEIVQHLDKEDKKIGFNRILLMTRRKIESIQNKSNYLMNDLSKFRTLLLGDNRAFQDILVKADKLIITNKYETTMLQNAIEELTIEIQGLNSKVARAATLGTLGTLAFIIGTVLLGVALLLGSGGTLTQVAVTTASIGFAAGVSGTAIMGTEFTSLAAYIKERNKKNKELNEKNKQLIALQNELGVLTAIKEQYGPLVVTGQAASDTAQNLYEGWGSIGNNFTALQKQIDKVEKPEDRILIQTYLKELLAIINELEITVKEHEDRRIIKNQIEASAASGLFAPSYQGTQPLTLPMPLYAAYVNRMQGPSLLS